MRTRVKICCISSLEEARLAVRAGADALGLVAAMPSGPGVIDDSLIREIALSVPPGVDTFLLSSRTDPEAILAHVLDCRTSVVQLVDSVKPEVYFALRRGAPNVRIVQVVHVEGPEALQRAQSVAEDVDAVLLDSGCPDGKKRELGGTGRTHDWAVSRQIVQELSVPVFLAGGLDPSNAARAIREVGPYGLDLCSGVRCGGRLDEESLLGFMQAVEEESPGR